MARRLPFRRYSAGSGKLRRRWREGRSTRLSIRAGQEHQQLCLTTFTGRNEPKGELAVFVMNADGSARHQVTHIAEEVGGAQWPVWSPNGRQIAIQVNNRTQKNSAHMGCGCCHRRSSVTRSSRSAISRRNAYLVSRWQADRVTKQSDWTDGDLGDECGWVTATPGHGVVAS